MKRTTVPWGWRGALSILVLALAAVAATALAADVRGTLRVPADYGRAAPEAEEDRRRNRYWEEWNGFLDPRTARFDSGRELAVVLTGEGPMAPEQPGFAIANGGLRPATVVARVGSNLNLQNTDPVTHQVYAEGLESFGATPLSPGLVRPQVVDQPGSWPLRDELYAHVRGHLHVLPDLVARARVHADGSYHFTNVPPGTYTLKVFHGEREVHTAQVTVAADRELVVDPIAISASQ